MKTGSTTLLNWISQSVPHPVLHTHNMEVASVKNMNDELEKRIRENTGLQGNNSVFENNEVYRITGDDQNNISKLFRPGDDIYIITAVRDPLSQKISHIMHALNLYNIFDEHLYTNTNTDSDSDSDPKKYLYEYLGKLLLETTNYRNIYFEYVFREKSLVSTEFILRSWESRKKRKCDYNFSLKYIIKKLLGEKETVIDKQFIKDHGYFNISDIVRDKVNFNALIVKTEEIDKLTDILSEFIGYPIKYKKHHRDKYDRTKTMYICKDDIHAVIKTIKEYAKRDPHILELYRDGIVYDLGYSIPQ